MKTFIGKIIAAGLNKHVTVSIERYEKHPLYGKILRKNKTIRSLDDIGAKVGDTVVIFETRPLSKTVNFKIKEIVGAKKSGAEKVNSVEKKEEKPKIKKQIKKVIGKREK